ncbi:FAD-binding oxidoreductase [Nostocoides vanveenii]|uniref:FAD-linked oxidase C-terminal domain-containing protein n=1 Tax=Nostocoides vanveenii TaxID=330835 RepID=A0ABP4X9T0_9MICO
MSLDELCATVGAADVVIDPARMAAYQFDWARVPGAGMPCAVVRPRTAAQVQAAVRWAASHGIPVVPRGAGTGLAGGASAIEGGLTISLEKMTAIKIDPATRTAVVEPGALNAAVKRAAAAEGLWYPPDPSSFEICSIGGNIATNAGGLCCVKYGVTTDYVLGLDVVLADGRLITLGGKRIKDVAGLSLMKLFVGSEGTLGIVTRVILRLLPEPPPASTLVAVFPTARAAAEAVVEMGRTIRASLVEFMDGRAINIVEDYTAMGLDRSAGGLLVIQSDAPGAACAQEMQRIEAVCLAVGCSEVYRTDDPQEGEAFLSARRAFFPASERLGSLLIEDVGVPVPTLPDLLDGISEIAARHDTDIPVVAHAGDGNTHPNLIFDGADPAARERAEAAFEEIMQLAIDLGGTITGEHGVGRAKIGALGAQLGPDVMEVTRAIKAALDPQGILNPGSGI